MYTFYFATCYWTVEEDYSEEEIGITSDTNEEEKDELLQLAYENFMSNYDCGWYEKV